jgi:Na+/H+ antiporter NhaC
MARGRAAKVIFYGIISGIVLSVVLIGGVIATGQTFGQRCAAVFERHTEAWSRCVADIEVSRSIPLADRNNEDRSEPASHPNDKGPGT